MGYFDSLEKNCKDLERNLQKIEDVELSFLDRMEESLKRMDRSLGSLQNDFLLIAGFGIACLISIVLICWWLGIWPW